MNTAKYGTTTRNITHTALPRPDTSCRRNRSPITVISSQNHSTKIKSEKTSSRKLPKLKPPAKNISALPPVRRRDRTSLRNQPAAVAYIDVSRAPSQHLAARWVAEVRDGDIQIVGSTPPPWQTEIRAPGFERERSR